MLLFQATSYYNAKFIAISYFVFLLVGTLAFQLVCTSMLWYIHTISHMHILALCILY